MENFQFHEAGALTMVILLPLQKTTREGVPPGLEDTAIAKVTIPTHGALLGFLNENIVGRPFKTEADLNEVLQQWPDYAREEHGLDVGGEFGEIKISSEGYIYCGTSPGGNFAIGVVRQT